MFICLFRGKTLSLQRQKRNEMMKKAVFLFVAMLMVFACSKNERAAFNYRGLPLALTATQFVDSMLARGFAIDSAASDSGRIVVFANNQQKYRVLMAVIGEKVTAVQEKYSLSTNDSTRRLWQELRDGLEKELGAWPDCPMLKDDHKVANFDANDGFISVQLENTHKPTVTVLYQPKK